MLALLLWTTTARGQYLSAILDTPRGEIPWQWEIGFIYMEVGTEFGVRFVLPPASSELKGLGFDLRALGPVELVALSIRDGAANSGSWLPPGEDPHWVQQIRVADFGACIPPGDSTALVEVRLHITGGRPISLSLTGPDLPIGPNIPQGIDCAGEPFLFHDGFPWYACINCPDPLDEVSFGTLKASF
jgi:hypothetical protein